MIMLPFVKRLIEEHKELSIRINKLQTYLYNGEDLNCDKEDKLECVDKCIQLYAMVTYRDALERRLQRQNINVVGNEYHQLIDTIDSVEVKMPSAGNDFDIDKNNNTNSKN